MNNTTLVKVKSKNEAYKCYRNTMDAKDYEKYAKARNQARWGCHKAKKIFERTLAKQIERPNGTLRLFSAMSIAN